MLLNFLVLLAIATIGAHTSVTKKSTNAFSQNGKRQTLEPTDIPSQCTALCAPLFSDVQNCGSLNTACLCSSTVRNDGINCSNCIASIFPSQLQPLQARADADVELCMQEGHPIDPVKLTGETSGIAPATPTATTLSQPTDSVTSSQGSPTASGGTVTPTAPGGTVKSNAAMQRCGIRMNALAAFCTGIWFIMA